VIAPPSAGVFDEPVPFSAIGVSSPTARSIDPQPGSRIAWGAKSGAFAAGQTPIVKTPGHAAAVLHAIEDAKDATRRAALSTRARTRK
jgi:hypothetical protein